MSFFVSDSEAAAPRPYVPLVAAANPPAATSGPTAIDSAPSAAPNPQGNLESPYQGSLSYSNEAGPLYTNGGVVVSPPNPPEAFASDEPYG